MVRRGLAMATVGLVAAIATNAGASPADLFGFGPKSQSRAGMGAATARGFEATYENPALLSLSHQRELALGYQVASYSLHVDGDNAPGKLSAEGLHGEFIGVVAPIPFGGVLEDRITIGLGVFTPSTLLARARLLYPERPQFPLITDRAQSLNFNLGVGADVGHGVRVGAGFMALAELVGTVVVRTDTTGRVGTGVDDQLIATYAPIVGAAWDFAPKWTAGLTYRGVLEGDFDVLVQVHDLGSLTVPELHISGVAQYDPMQLHAEVARKLGDWTLAGGVIYRRWSPFHGWTKPTVECPETQPDCAALVPPPVDFHDTVSPRIGASYDFRLSSDAKAELRGGYAFEPTPLGEQTSAANYYDSHRHVLAVGYGIDLAEPLPPITLDVFWQLQMLAPRTHTKDPGVDPQNAGYPKVDTHGFITNVGVVAGVKF